MRRVVASLAPCTLAVLAACTDPAQPDGPLAPIPLLVQTDLDAPPLFSAIRAEGEPWQQVPFDGTGRFEIEIAGAYELFYVCEDGDRVWTQVILSEMADGLSRTIGCTPIAGPAPTVTVTGRMQQAGRVQLGLGHGQSSTTAPWTYSLEVPRGTYDLVAHDGDRVVVQRALAIADATALAPIDLATGAAFAKTRMRYTGVLGDEAVSTQTLLATENGLSELTFDGDMVRDLPAEVLTANDQTLTLARADSQYTHREMAVFSLPDVFFPPRLEGIELTDASVRWDALPAGTDAWFTVTNARVALLVVATGRWLAGRHVLHTDFTVEGYRDAWRIDPALSRRRELSFQLGGGATTSYGYDVLAP